MNAHQAVCHLTDSFQAAMGGKSVSSASGLFQRTLMKFGALYIPAPWPKGVPTRPEIDQCAGGGTAPAQFAADLAKLLATFDGFAASRPGRWPPHPIFGALSQWQWMRWGYLHTDHHLRQFGV
jgi:hypothetical protein